MSRKHTVAVCFLFGLLLGPLGRLHGASFEALDFGPYAVNANGSVIVGTNSVRYIDEAVRWTAETGAVGMGFLHPENEESWARGVSADGSVVVGWSRNEAFRWTAETAMVGLGFLEGNTSSHGRGVSANGSVAVGSSGGTAFRWTAETDMVSLGSLAGYSSQAYAVSADGLVVVGWSGEAFRWTAETGMVGIGELTFGGTAGTAASADGAVVVGDSGRQAFRWTAETGMVSLGTLRPLGSHRHEAHGISADGSLIVGTTLEITTRPWDDPVLAWIWDETHGMRDLQEVLTNDFGLDLTGWELVSARDISADGRVIVGWAWYEPPGEFPRRLGYRAVIPEPSTLLLFTSALLPLLAYGWRNQRRAYKG